jgi:transglutaminase-like putative cysteine protease
MRYLLVVLVVLSHLLTSCKKDNTNKEQKSEKVTIADVEAGIRANIEAKTRENGGFFQISNDSLDLSLKLVRVHTEYLSVLGPDEFFACVDLATENGDVYDVDFFMKGKPGDMELTRTSVHKLNGKPYYSWKQAEDKTWYTVPIKNASTDLLGVVEGEDEFTFTYQIELPEIDNPAQIWIPLAKTDDWQEVTIRSIDMPVKEQRARELDFGNEILYLQLGPESSNKTISIVYQVKRKEKTAYPDPIGDTLRYLGEAAFLPVNERFMNLADSVVSAKQAVTPLTKARALYDYVIETMRYAKQGKYGTGDATYACDSRSGNCTEFHSLFISLARSTNIPARFAVGAAIPSERNEGGVNGYHCWAEFYAEGKWWPVDISEANKYTSLATYYFGHHPANRIEFSKGRNIKPDPLPASGSINFLAYPVYEVDGQQQLVKTNFSFTRKDS